MSTEATNKVAAPKAAAPKPAPVKKQKFHSYITVDKNSYEKNVSALANSGATIVAITVNPNVLNSFDIHYSKLV